jgi:hypothetical protein
MHCVAQAINGLSEIVSHLCHAVSPSDGSSSSRLGRAGGSLRIQPPIIDRALRKINREWLSLGGFEAIM